MSSPNSGNSAIAPKGFLSGVEVMAKIFLCHANEDKPQVREVYQRLKAEGFEPWLDEEELLPGQRWEDEIYRALNDSDFIMIFLSPFLIHQGIYLQRDFRIALDILEHIDERIIHTIPVRLEDCDIPEQLRSIQFVDLFNEDGFEQILKSIYQGLSQRQQSNFITPTIHMATDATNLVDGSPVHIFLGCAAEDFGKVEQIYMRLKELGFYNVWMSHKDLLPGQRWDFQIRTAMQSSDLIFLFLSKHSVLRRGYVQREFALALEIQEELPSGFIHTIPVRLDDCEVPNQLRRFQCINLFEERGFNQIVEVINIGLTQRNQQGSEPLEIQNLHTRKEWFEELEDFSEAPRRSRDFGYQAQHYSVFISYSHQDEGFAQRLHDALQGKGVRCWYAPENMSGGKKIHEQIDEAIRVYDKLLLVLSEHSMNSEWVKTELANARQREIDENRRMLFPIRLVDYEKIRAWKCFDADPGKDSAREIREYFIPDFSNWEDHDSFEKAFSRLLRDLQADEMKGNG